MSTTNPIDLSIGVSKWMRRWVFGLLIISLMLIAQLSQQWSGYLILMFPLGWYLGRVYLRWVLLTDERSINRIVVRDREIDCMTVGGQSYSGTLSGQQWLSHWLIILRYRQHQGKSHFLPIFCDATNEQDFHRLLVALKIID